MTALQKSRPMLPFIGHIKERRKKLRQQFDVARQMRELEETCVPSYLHPNLAAAMVAWMRLFAAARMYRRYAPDGPVLDFGAASGELANILPGNETYDFVEFDEPMAKALADSNPRAVRRYVENLPVGHYAAIFALDSLEHNDDVGAIVDKLIPSLRPDGVLILSGPTENWLYRLGRRIAGFSGEYHKTTIYDIEREFSARLNRLKCQTLPIGLPLFRVSCWRVSQP